MLAIKRNELKVVFILALKLCVSIFRQAILFIISTTPPISNTPPMAHFKIGTSIKDPSLENSDY